MTQENNPTRGARRGHTPMPTKGKALRTRGGSTPQASRPQDRPPRAARGAAVALRCCAAALLLAVAGCLALPALAQAQTAPTVDSVSVVSDPGADDTYGLNDTITVAVVFTAAVTVTGTPQITLRVGGGAAVNLKPANYASGSGTTTLRFSYVVQAGDMDDNGIYLQENELVLNGGTIQSLGGTDATLTYPTEGQQNGHKVDGSIADTTPPVLDSATVAADGTIIELVFDEPYDFASLVGFPANALSVTAAGSTVTIGGLDTVVDEGSIPFTYRTIRIKELSPAITYGQVVTVSYTDPTTGDDASGVLEDAAGNDVVTFTTGSGGVPAVVNNVPNPAATITSIAFTSDPGNDDTYRLDDAIKATVTFSAAVTVTGTPQFVLNVGGAPRRADYESGSGSTDLVFSYTVVVGDEDTDGVAVEKDEIALNGGTITAGGTAATRTYDGVAADPTHKVDGIRPIFVSAETTVDGMQILVTFSENLKSASPAAFQVYDGSVDAARPDVESVLFTENVVTLELDRAIVSGVSLTLTIGEGAVHDAANNANPVSLNKPITNNVPSDGTAIAIDAKDAAEVLEGRQARLEVRLRAMPSVPVTVGVMSRNTGKVTVSPVSFAFTTTNWNEFQNLTITPADDPDSSDETVTLTLSGTGVTTKTVTVDVADDEMSLTLPSRVRLTEGAMATFDVTLASAPSARFPRTVTVSSGNTAAVTVAPPSLTFTSTDWNQAQTVTVTGKQDGNTTGERVTISFSAHDVQNGTVTVDVTDDDDGGGGGGGVTPPDDSTTPEPAEPPGMPRNLSAMGGNGAVTLTWDAPADHGGSAITGYRIEVSDDGGRTWTDLVANLDNTTYTQTGLQPGETRHYQVSAINAEGPGAPSMVASATTPTRPPDPPRNLRATGGDGEATLTWAAPTDDGGSAITSYEYRYAQGETIPAGMEWLSAGLARRVPVTGLENRRRYRFEVHAVNDSGAGEPAVVHVTVGQLDRVAQAWLSRFGRTVATHVTDAVGERLRASPGQDSHLTVGGYRLPLRQPGPARDEAEAPPVAALVTGLAGVLGLGPGGSGGPGDAGIDPGAPLSGMDPRLGQSRTLTLTLRQILQGSSFRLTLGADADGAAHPRLTAWGRMAATQYDGRAGTLAVDGDVLTGLIGVDGAWDRLLAGVAVSHSRGDGAYTLSGSAARRQGDLEQTLTSLHPYLRYAVTERLDVWGLLGYGWGELTLAPGGESALTTDTALLMGAFGGRGILLAATESGGFEVATRTDAMLTRTTADAVAGMDAADAAAHRVRVILEGSRGFTWAEGRRLTPTVQLGLRHDWGDAETGFGLEVGGRVQYADPGLGLTVEGAVRALLAHEDEDYEEWGAWGTVRVDPGPLGQGLSLTLSPTWGAAASGVEGLWSRQTTAGLASPGQRQQPAGRLTAEVGYGFTLFDTGLLTPYAGTVLADGAARTYRVGTRLNVAGRNATGLTLSLEGQRQESAGQQPVNQGLQLQITWGF